MKLQKIHDTIKTIKGLLERGETELAFSKKNILYCEVLEHIAKTSTDEQTVMLSRAALKAGKLRIA